MNYTSSELFNRAMRKQAEDAYQFAKIMARYWYEKG
jgi:hypothetical protein